MPYYWNAQVGYDGENFTVSLWHSMGPSLPIASGVGKGISYLDARDRAVKNSDHLESDWSRLLPELDEMIYEATSYGIPGTSLYSGHPTSG